MTTLACPNCHGVDRLGTLERLTGIAGTGIRRTDDGKLDLDYEGSTDVDWDSSRTVGVVCRECWWDHEGEDWADQLEAVPGPEARIAAALALYDQFGPDTPADEDLAGQALAVTAEQLADPRVRVLLPLVEGEVNFTDDGWANCLSDVFDVVVEHLPTVVDGVLSEPARA